MSRARESTIFFARGVVLAVAVAGLAACSSSSSGGGSSNTGGTTPAAQGKGTTVVAVETEFKIALNTTSFSPGTYTFDAENQGKTTHALEITGPGVSGAKTSFISPGKSASLTVTLQKGSYDIFCPVANHKSLGMNDEITVG